MALGVRGAAVVPCCGQRLPICETMSGSSCVGVFADKVPPAWDPSYHGSAMMAPVCFVAWVIVVLLSTLLLYVGVRLFWLRRRSGSSKPYVRLTDAVVDESGASKWPSSRTNGSGDVEMAGAAAAAAGSSHSRHSQ